MFKWVRVLMYLATSLCFAPQNCFQKSVFKRVEQCSRDFGASFNGSLKKSNELENSHLYKSKLYTDG